MADEIKFRWVEGPTCDDADWDRIAAVVTARGWLPMDRGTTRVLIAEDSDGLLAGFLCVQILPHTEPLYIAKELMGSGLAEELVDRVVGPAGFLAQRNVTGYIASAESKFAEALCVKNGMTKLEYPVYVKLAARTREN